MIGGVFETIGKTLGVGKDNYFLELDDADEDTVTGIEKVAPKAPAAAAAADTGKVAAAAVVETTEKVTTTATATKTTSPKATQKTAAKKQPAAEPAPAAAPAPDPNDLIVSAIAAGDRKESGVAVGPQGEAINFSTDYLISKKKMSRRRPGPSLNQFKGMAKSVNSRSL
ncbi:MAG: hypothetical protein AAF703_01770 [Cyanobacteria bacterium P01_D01_bin.105]